MSRNRFEQILGSIHVGDIDPTPRRNKIQPFIDLISSRFKAVYIPHQQIAVDEAMISFKGRISFRQYLQGKPHPWGIKAYVLAESNTGYLYSLCIYYGKETQLTEHADLNQTTRIVLTLAEPLEDQGYDLFCDRFYTSPILAVELHKRKFTITGTVQANRKGMPAAVKEVRGARKSKQQKTRHTARAT